MGVGGIGPIMDPEQYLAMRNSWQGPMLQSPVNIGPVSDPNEYGKLADKNKWQGPLMPEEGLPVNPFESGTPQPPPGFGAMDAATKKRLEEFIKSQESQNKYQAMLSGMAAGAPVQLDISPLAALTDSLTGSKLQQGYDKPQGIKERIGQQSAFAELQRKGAADIVDQLSKQGSNKAQMEYLKMVGTQKRSDRNYDFQTREKLFRGFEGNKIVVGAKEALAGVGSARELLNSGTSVGENAFKQALARASGEKGPLSDQDVERYAGSPALAATGKRMLEKYKTGRLTDADRAEFSILIDVMERRQLDVLNKEKSRFINKVAPNVYRVSSQDAEEILSGVGDYQAPPAAAQPSNSPVGHGGWTAEKEAEYRRLGGK